MGCCTSSSRKQPENIPQEEDKHVSGLSKKQRFLLKGSWKGISRDLEKTTENLAQELMQRDETFPMREDEIFLMTEQLMDRVDLVVFHLEEENTILEILQNTSMDLKNQYNLSTFSNIPEPLLCTIGMILEERYTQQMETIYKLFIPFIFEIMEDRKSTRLNSVTQ